MTPLTMLDWRTTLDCSEQHRIGWAGLCLARLFAMLPVLVRQMNRSTSLSSAIWVAVEQSMSVARTFLPSCLESSLASLKAYS